MAQALETRAMKDDILAGNTPKAKKRQHRLVGLGSKGRIWKHATLDDLMGLVEPRELDDMFVFTLVRNPWDRIVSYYHWLRERNFQHAAVGLAQNLEFAEFVAHPEISASLRYYSYQSYLTVDGVCHGHFLRLEHFHEDAQPLWDHLGFTLDLPRLNRSDRNVDYRTYYDEALAAHVARICAQDIARFGYSFENTQ